MYTLDASVHVSALNSLEPESAASQALLRMIHQRQIPLFCPTLLPVEVAAAIARRMDETDGAVALAALVRGRPNQTLVPLAWSTKAVRDAFFASPQLPRLLDPGALRRTIADGAAQKLLAYVGPKGEDGKYYPFVFGETLLPGQVEFSDDMFVITAEEAKKQIEEPRLSRLAIHPASIQLKPGDSYGFSVQGFDQHDRLFALREVVWEAQGFPVDDSGRVTAGEQEGYFFVSATKEAISATAEIIVAKGGVKPPPPVPPPPPPAEGLVWEGQVPPQKWMNFYTRVLARFATQPDLKLRVRFEVKEGVSQQKADETRVALRELGLDEGGLQVVQEE